MTTERDSAACVSPEAPRTEAARVDAFFRTQYRALVHFLRQHTPTPEDAEDDAQESLTRFFSRYRQTHPPAAWKPMLYRIAINLTNDRWRRRNLGEHHRVPLDEADAEWNQSSTERVAVRAQQRERLREAILSLPPMRKQVYLLKMRGLPAHEVAARCGISTRWAEQQWAEALRQIRRRLR